jgi:hypothetical protein
MIEFGEFHAIHALTKPVHPDRKLLFADYCDQASDDDDDGHLHYALTMSPEPVSRAGEGLSSLFLKQ